jgi:hypothetical protein
MNYKYYLKEILIKDYFSKEHITRKELQIIEKDEKDNKNYFFVQRLISYHKEGVYYSFDTFEIESAKRTICWLKNNHPEFFI